MDFFVSRSQPYQSGNRGPRMGSFLLMPGLLCVFAGIAIIAAPELLAYFVASVFLIIGASLIGMWWRMRS